MVTALTMFDRSGSEAKRQRERFYRVLGELPHYLREAFVARVLEGMDLRARRPQFCRYQSARFPGGRGGPRRCYASRLGCCSRLDLLPSGSLGVCADRMV